jgi:hypothetical protein
MDQGQVAGLGGESAQPLGGDSLFRRFWRKPSYNFYGVCQCFKRFSERISAFFDGLENDTSLPYWASLKANTGVLCFCD